jgi:hypothetical protein
MEVIRRLADTLDLLPPLQVLRPFREIEVHQVAQAYLRWSQCLEFLLMICSDAMVVQCLLLCISVFKQSICLAWTQKAFIVHLVLLSTSWSWEPFSIMVSHGYWFIVSILTSTDSSQVDFRDPNAFYNDIAAVTTLLKHFLRDLKDPLLTSAQYNAFIQAAKFDDDTIRRDALHATINSLPDPNYATLRTIILHLNRVSQHSAQNRMTANNLAIVFGPTLMIGQTSAPNENFGDSGYQARVIETILNNTYQIFDDDE